MNDIINEHKVEVTVKLRVRLDADEFEHFMRDIGELVLAQMRKMPAPFISISTVGVEEK